MQHFTKIAHVSNIPRPDFRVMNKFFSYIVRQISTQIDGKAEIMTKSYEDAVRALNTLQSNAAALEMARKERDRLKHCNIPETQKFCERTGLSLDDLDKLSIIHVSGTKGKGSTCALTESILRHHGYKTGFYSSPHLIEVRERLRINGRPLSKEMFSSYFWECYKRLEDTKADHNNKMPPYSRFLTVMAFNVFLQEEVDVVILEVGIGGEYDCTNVIRTPVVCGIASLGLDHTSILGDTIAKIAWQKAGILKPGFPGVTVPQPEDGLDIIAERAQEKQCPIYLAPNLHQHDWRGRIPMVGLVGEMQQWNASLAIQLSKIWMENHRMSIEERRTLVARDSEMTGEDIPLGEVIPMSEPMASGLKNCRWPGRNQTVYGDHVTYYLDGAHTNRSMNQCIQWFNDVSEKERSNIRGKVSRVLLFNLTGDRRPEGLLEHLVKCNFDAAVFCPNVATLSQENAGATPDISSDMFDYQLNLMTTKDSQNSRCQKNRNAWIQLLGEMNEMLKTNEKSTQENNNKVVGLDCVDSGIMDDVPLVGEVQNDFIQSVQVFQSVRDSFEWILKGLEVQAGDGPRSAMEGSSHIQVLVTGSIHLIGCSLRLLDPHMNDRDLTP